MAIVGRGGSCRAGDEHVFEHFDAERMGPLLSCLYGEFTACNKCGMRPNQSCPKSPSGYGDHDYQPAKKMSEYGLINIGKCRMCGKEVK